MKKLYEWFGHYVVAETADAATKILKGNLCNDLKEGDSPLKGACYTLDELVRQRRGGCYELDSKTVQLPDAREFLHAVDPDESLTFDSDDLPCDDPVWDELVVPNSLEDARLFIMAPAVAWAKVLPLGWMCYPQDW